jgi:hypothetical protein
MQVPGGQVNPGLSFFRAIQGLVQRPNQAGEAQQARSAASPTDRVTPQQRFESEPARAARAADPSEDLAKTAEGNPNMVNAIDEEIGGRQTVGGARFVPRGTLLDLTV